MANEFKHASVGSDLDQAEWESIDAHTLDSAATGDLIYFNGTRLVRLPIGSTGYDLRVVGGIPTWSAPSANTLLLGTNLTDAVTAAVTDVLILDHTSSGTAAAGFGTGLLFRAETSTTNSTDMARIQARWSTATHASRASAIDFQTLTSAGGLTTQITISDTGNLIFASTGQRITGDMSNATQTSRLLFQSSTTNGSTILGVLPNGTSTTGQLTLYNSSDAGNPGFVRLRVVGAAVDLSASGAGSGTVPTTLAFSGFASGYSFDQVVTISAGNLVFSSTAQRITGDMSNATISSRWGVQNSVTNGGSFPVVVPNGTGTGAGWISYNTNDPSNAGSVAFYIANASARALTGKAGTGTEPATFDIISTLGTMASWATATGLLTLNYRVGIGAAPSTYGLLDLTSTVATLIIPRMTTTQRDAMTAVNGMLVYNSTLGKFQGYEAGAWNNFSVL